jgi:hypothetical protein
MQGWTKLQTSLAGLNIGESAGKVAKGFNSTVQATKERLGQVSADDITELPQEYKDLEARVDALRQTHLQMLRITRVFESETYDYPTQVQESIVELSSSISHNVTSFAAANLKGTSLPVPNVTPQAPAQHKTLPHALSRAAASGANALGPESRVGKGLATYSRAMSSVGQARLDQDAIICDSFLAPWQVTLNSSIAVAMKARQAVKASRLELDTTKATLKSAAPARQEQARLEVENAEDDLVQKTEVAITLMKTVLENPEPLKNLNELIKAQLIFHSSCAEALAAAQGDIEELSVAAEGEYRKSRDH